MDTENNETVTDQRSNQASKPVVLGSTKIENWMSDRRAALDHIRNNPHDLTLEFLRDNGLPVYVKNTIKSGQVILVTMLDAGGRRTSHRIEKTWIPQNLSERYAYDTIMRSDELKDLIFRRAVLLIHPEEAINALKSPRAQEVLKKFHSRFAGSAPIDNESTTAEGEVSERMKNIVNNINTGKLLPDDAVTEVMNCFIMLNEADFHYLYERFAGKREFSAMVDEIRKQAKAEGKHS
jgi:hypothetical protein